MRDRLLFEAAAPIIISGRVREALDIGSPSRSQGDSPVLVQLTRLSVEVEEVIKGEVSTTGPVGIYLFTDSSHNEVDLGVPSYIPMAGQHRVYFLRWLDGAYRSVGDVTNYNLTVDSGYHAKGFCSGKKPGCCIAELLLTPGRDMDEHRFASSLYDGEYSASVVCSPSVALSLVRKLVDHPNKDIAGSAADLLLSLAASHERYN